MESNCLVRVLVHAVLVICFFGSVTFAVPLNFESSNKEFGNNSLAAEPANSLHRSGCRYKATVFGSGDNVPTDEPCLFCHCKGSVVVCKLRICPEVPDPPPPGCIVVQKANKCCSQLVCHDNHSARKLSREQRLEGGNQSLPLTSEAVVGALNDGNSCIHDGTVYAEGSAMRSSTLCQHCFCIRGQMKCSSPQCVIPMNGCKPRFRSYACCPTNYDCNQSNGTSILKTIPTSTPIPQFLKGCRVGGRFVAEGQPVLPMTLAIEHRGNNSDICQTCFCMGGVVHCRPLECDRPIQGCRPVVEHGHCCPDRYECDELESTTAKTMKASTTTMKAASSTLANVSYANVNVVSKKDVSTSRQSNQQQLIPKILSMRARKDDEAEATTLMTFTLAEEEKEAVTLISVTATSPVLPPVKKATRISTTSVGGFKNRSEGGSREERRNKDRLEYLSRSFYEDDAREDTSSSSSENSRQSDEQSSVFFDEVTDHSRSNSDTDDSNNNSDDSTAVPPTGASEIQEESGTETSNKIDSTLVTENTVSDDYPKRTTESPLVVIQPIIEMQYGKDKLTAEQSKTSGVSSANLTDLNKTMVPTPTSAPNSNNLADTTAGNGNLEFIAFGMEDAVHSPMNETRYEIYPGQATSLPSYDTAARQGSLIPPTLQKGYLAPKPLKLQALEVNKSVENATIFEDPVPIIVEKEEIRNVIMDVPVQTSLYNNGYYNHGLIIEDPARNDDELIITQAEMGAPASDHRTSGFHGHVYNEDEDNRNIGIGEAVVDTVPPPPPPTTEGTTQRSVVPAALIQNPEGPLKGISSSQNFIPSYSPVLSPQPKNETDGNPSRTYSKFGLQDSSHHRYGFVPSNPSDSDHQIYYNPDDVVPNLDEPMAKTQLPNKESPQGRLRYNSNSNPYHPYEDPFVYEDESEEFNSFENFFAVKTTPPPLRNRYGAPYTGTNVFNPVPLISSSGSTVSLSTSKTKTTKKPSTMTRIVNSKPMRRPKPIEDQRLDSDPLGFKPVVAFPFTIPKSQNNYNMGLKLSGCNIYGKMYGVGQVIHELSSICVQCQCTEVGVQCSELQC